MVWSGVFQRLYDRLSGRAEARLESKILDQERRFQLLVDYLREQLMRIERDDRVLNKYVQGLASESRATRDLHGRMIDRLVRQYGGTKPTPLPPPHPDAQWDPDKTEIWVPDE